MIKKSPRVNISFERVGSHPRMLKRDGGQFRMGD
jgi:hypothetical protein